MLYKLQIAASLRKWNQQERHVCIIRVNPLRQIKTMGVTALAPNAFSDELWVIWENSREKGACPANSCQQNRWKCFKTFNRVSNAFGLTIEHWPQVFMNRMNRWFSRLFLSAVFMTPMDWEYLDNRFCHGFGKPSWRVLNMANRVRNYGVCMRIKCRIISLKRMFWKIIWIVNLSYTPPKFFSTILCS